MRTLNPDLLFFIQWLRLIPHLTTPIRKQFSQNNKLNQKNKTKAAVRLGNNKVSEFSRRLERFNKRIKSPAFKLGNKLSLTHVLWLITSRKHIFCWVESCRPFKAVGHRRPCLAASPRRPCLTAGHGIICQRARRRPDIDW